MTQTPSPFPERQFFYGIDQVRVVDGDTIYCRIDLGFNIRVDDYVRLYGINAPESIGPKKGEPGQWATIYVKLWMMGLEDIFDDLHSSNLEAANGRLSVLVQTTPEVFYLHSNKYDERDKYGRCLGTIYRHGTDESLNDALIRKGLAVVYLP